MSPATSSDQYPTWCTQVVSGVSQMLPGDPSSSSMWSGPWHEWTVRTVHGTGPAGVPSPGSTPARTTDQSVPAIGPSSAMADSRAHVARPTW